MVDGASSPSHRDCRSRRARAPACWDLLARRDGSLGPADAATACCPRASPTGSGTGPPVVRMRR